MSDIPLKKVDFYGVFLFLSRRIVEEARKQKQNRRTNLNCCACFSVSSIFHELCSCSLSLHSFVIPPSLSSIKLQVFSGRRSLSRITINQRIVLFECQIQNSIAFSTKFKNCQKQSHNWVKMHNVKTCYKKIGVMQNHIRAKLHLRKIASSA